MQKFFSSLGINIHCSNFEEQILMTFGHKKVCFQVFNRYCIFFQAHVYLKVDLKVHVYFKAFDYFAFGSNYRINSKFLYTV